jgi:hypothetical protein
VAVAVFLGKPDTSTDDRIARQIGLHIVREPPPPVEVWADHFPAARLFAAMTTQWHRDAAGRLAGLRYESLVGLATEIYQVPDEERVDVFEDIRVMEAAILEYQASRATQAGASVPQLAA